MSENIDKEKCINDNNENEQNKEEINKNIDNKDINPPPLETEEEDGINKEDIKDIVDYLSNLDYEKYSRDMEIKEALMILKTKMDKYQEEKGKEQEIQNEKIKIIEDNNLTIFNKNKDINQNNNDEEKINYQNQNKINMNKIEDENKAININEIKEPKEIIDEEEVKTKEKIEKYKIAEKIAKNSALKDVHSVQSVQKLLLRENIDDQAPLRITIIKKY